MRRPGSSSATRSRTAADAVSRSRAATSSRRTGLSLLLGLVSLPASIVAWLLLLITVVGIPVAILLPIVYGVMIWAGQIAASYVVGCKLLRRRFGEGSAMGPIAAGS